MSPLFNCHYTRGTPPAPLVIPNGVRNLTYREWSTHFPLRDPLGHARSLASVTVDRCDRVESTRGDDRHAVRKDGDEPPVRRYRIRTGLAHGFTALARSMERDRIDPRQLVRVGRRYPEPAEDGSRRCRASALADPRELASRGRTDSRQRGRNSRACEREEEDRQSLAQLGSHPECRYTGTGWVVPCS